MLVEGSVANISKNIDYLDMPTRKSVVTALAWIEAIFTSVKQGKSTEIEE